MKIPNNMEVVVKAGARGALPARALASPIQPHKEISRKARYTLDLGALNPLKRRTEGD
jgi:hypothetical protein